LETRVKLSSSPWGKKLLLGFPKRPGKTCCSTAISYRRRQIVIWSSVGPAGPQKTRLLIYRLKFKKNVSRGALHTHLVGSSGPIDAVSESSEGLRLRRSAQYQYGSGNKKIPPVPLSHHALAVELLSEPHVGAATPLLLKLFIDRKPTLAKPPLTLSAWFPQKSGAVPSFTPCTSWKSSYLGSERARAGNVQGKKQTLSRLLEIDKCRMFSCAFLPSTTVKSHRRTDQHTFASTSR